MLAVTWEGQGCPHCRKSYEQIEQGDLGFCRWKGIQVLSMAAQCLRNWLLNEVVRVSGMKTMYVFPLAEADIFTTKD